MVSNETTAMFCRSTPICHMACLMSFQIMT